MRTTDLVTTAEAVKGFYPTPPALADELVSGLKWYLIDSVLEPSAGNGNLVKRLTKSYRASSKRNSTQQLRVDCIEIDPALRGVLTYELCGPFESELKDRRSALYKKIEYNSESRCYGEHTTAEKNELESINLLIDSLECASVGVIHDDFLTFTSRKQYSLIIMNPPFSDGDKHLMKAIQLQSANGGMVRCILNAETILNPCTNLRILLKKKLDELGAEISFVDGAFEDAERKTDVRVAVIKLHIPKPQRESIIFERLTKAAESNLPPVDDITDIAIADYVQHIVSRYNVEIDAGLELIQEYEAMRLYMLTSFEKSGGHEYPMITLVVGSPQRFYQGGLPDANQYIRMVRSKYWGALFSNKDFVGQLTSNLREKYRSMVDSLEEYDFTVFNIRNIQAQMNAEMVTGIQETIISMFERLSNSHSWYPETKNNVHYYNGWKTNKVHMVNHKVILPVNGMFSDYSWSKSFEVRAAESVIDDIEKVFNYLDGNMTEPVDLNGALEQACRCGQTKNIYCKYFDVTLYKKGTMHIKFRNLELLRRFNIYVGRGKSWLPPSYGSKNYADMQHEERAVVDSFHGDGADGSGKLEYQKVMERKTYYLSAPEREIYALSSQVALPL